MRMADEKVKIVTDATGPGSDPALAQPEVDAQVSKQEQSAPEAPSPEKAEAPTQEAPVPQDKAAGAPKEQKAASVSVFNFSEIMAEKKATERAAAQRLWYMQHLFPVVYAIALGLAYLLAFLQVQSRRRELRTMRSVGADRKTAYGSLFLEQLMLAALGAVLGAGLCLALGWGSRLGLGLTAAFAVLWLLGAHVALCRANSRHILKNRREVE